MRKFTNEQWEEIEAARERLRQYKLKIQPYPAYPQDEATTILPRPPAAEPEWSQQQWQYVQQLKAQVNYLNTKVTELLLKTKRTSQY